MLDLSKAREDVRLAAGTVDASRKQKIENAIKAADDLRKSYGNTEIGTESLFIKGNALYLKQDYDGAIAAYQEYVERDPRQGQQSQRSDCHRLLL